MPSSLAELKTLLAARMPATDLDGTGVVVERTPAGLGTRVDPARFRRATRIAGALVGGFVALFALAPIGAFRWVVLGLALLLVVGGFAVRPRDDRVLVSPDGVEAWKKGARSRRVERDAVSEVVLEREVTITTDSDGDRREKVTWPVRLSLGGGESWFLAVSATRTKARSFAEDSAIALGVPFRDSTGGTATVVPADAVNLTLAERVERGIVTGAAGGAAPAALRVADDGVSVEWSVKRRNWKAFAALGFMGFWFMVLGYGGTVAVVLGALETSLWILFVALIPLFFGLVGTGLVVGGLSAVNGERYLRVDRGGIHSGIRRWGRERGKTFDPADYEDLRNESSLVLVGDHKEDSLGFQELDAAGRDWLRAAVLDRVGR